MLQRFSFDEKLQRADQHLKSLKREVKRWTTGNPYRIVDEVDPQTGDNVIKLGPIGVPPPIVPIVLGDCVYNLRSALDHLVYLLAIRRDHFPGLPIIILEDFRDTQFPIFRDKIDFAEKAVRDIRRIDPGAQAVIERLQPYHASNPDTHWLWLLNELSNIDKHRRLNVAVSVQEGVGISPKAGTTVQFLQYFGPLGTYQAEAEVARYRAVKLSDGKTRVNVNFHPTSHVAFAHGPAEGRDVLVTIKGIRDYIAREVFPRFSEFIH